MALFFQMIYDTIYSTTIEFHMWKKNAFYSAIIIRK